MLLKRRTEQFIEMLILGRKTKINRSHIYNALSLFRIHQLCVGVHADPAITILKK